MDPWNETFGELNPSARAAAMMRGYAPADAYFKRNIKQPAPFSGYGEQVAEEQEPMQEQEKELYDDECDYFISNQDEINKDNVFYRERDIDNIRKGYLDLVEANDNIALTNDGYKDINERCKTHVHMTPPIQPSEAGIKQEPRQVPYKDYRGARYYERGGKYYDSKGRPAPNQR